MPDKKFTILNCKKNVEKTSWSAIKRLLLIYECILNLNGGSYWNLGLILVFISLKTNNVVTLWPK